jgi:uncharacterized membrane protein
MVLALLVLAVAVLVRVAALDIQGLWHDELYTLGNLVGFDVYLFPGADLAPQEGERAAATLVGALQPDRFWQNLWRNLVHEGHPPLYLFLLKAWTALFGSSLAWVRGFSIAASTLAVAVVMACGRRLGGWGTGLAAGLLFALSPYQLYFAVESRSYALMTLWAAAATWAWIRFREGGTRDATAVWMVAVSAACLTHYFAALYCGLLYLSLAAWMLRHTALTKTLQPLIVRALPLLAGVAWLPVLRLQTASHGGSHWTEGRLGWAESFFQGFCTLLELLSSPHASASKTEVAFTLVVGSVSLGWMLACRGHRWGRTAWSLVALVTVHMVVVVLVDQVIDHHTIAVPRYSSCLAIPLFLVFAMALSRLRVAGAVLVGVFSVTLGQAAWEIGLGQRAPKQMIREVALHLNTVAHEGDLIIVSPSGPTLVGLAYYLRPELRIAAEPAASLEDAVEAASRDGRRVWTVQQRLGIGIEPWAADSQPEATSVIRFVGIDLAQH